MSLQCKYVNAFRHEYFRGPAEGFGEASRPLFISLILIATAAGNASPGQGDTTYLNIVLRPRNYFSPRDMDNFTCGIDKAVEPAKLLAELNSVYLLEYLDNSEDPSFNYRTVVYDVAFFSPSETLVQMATVCGEQCAGSGYGLQSLILIPPSRQCYSGLFKDAQQEDMNYFVVYVGNTITDYMVSDYAAKALKLKHLFGGQIPKLCGTKTFMRSQVAETRIETLTTLFSFFLNETRQFSDPLIDCRTSTDTEQSLAFSGLFDYSYDDVAFNSENDTAIESNHIFSAMVNRTSTGKTGVAFLETKLGTCDKDDLVPFNGPLAFKSGEGFTNVFIQLKKDNISENNENFQLVLKNLPTRVRRGNSSPTGKKMPVYLRNNYENIDEEIVKSSVKVFTLPVGQGDSTIIECPNKNGLPGDITIIDMGATHHAYGRNAFIRDVKEFVGNRIGHIFLTHADDDHINHGYKRYRDKISGILVDLVRIPGHPKIKVHLNAEDNWSDAENLLRWLKGDPTKDKDWVDERTNLFDVQHYTEFGTPPLVDICGLGGQDPNIKIEIINGNLGTNKNSKSLVLKLIHKVSEPEPELRSESTVLFLGDLEG